MAEPIDVGSTIAGYRIVEVIGRGGMGVVYRADQPQLGRQVAIKLIAPELARNEPFRERFRRESRLAAAIEHPNAIPIYDAGITDDGIPYLAMRYVAGTDMRSLIARQGRLEPGRAARIIEQVAGALDEAHGRGLVHRDVKPGNILVSQRRGHEHAYLTDFGLTKDLAGVSALTATGQWVGTADYASPEQIEGKRVDARADVYALGCVLFEALTGRVPFQRDSELAKLFAHANEPPPAPSSVADGLPAGIDDVVIRSLAKDPDERFPSAGDLGRAAVAAAFGRDVTAPERTVAAGTAAPGARAEEGAETVPPRPAAPTVPAQATEATRPAKTEPAEHPAESSTAAERPSEPTRPLPPATGAARRRYVLPGLILVAVLGAALAAALGFGLFGEGDDPGINGTGLQYEPATPGGAYQVEFPAGWEPALTEAAEGQCPEGATNLRTRRVRPDGNVWVGVNRCPDDVADPRAVAEGSHQVNEARAGYERVGLEDVELDTREAALYEFVLDHPDLGPSRVFAYFFNFDGDSYRVQGVAANEGGAEAATQAAQVAEHAASTLREPGG